MQPTQGKILIIDDDRDIHTALGMYLEMGGFETVSVLTRQEALDLVPYLGELGIGAALIDGNLSPSSSFGADGKDINAAIKSSWGDNVRTAGISASHPIPDADLPSMSIHSPSLFREELANL